MLWCQGAQNIGLSNHELKSALTCTVGSESRDKWTDRRTDEHHGNSATGDVHKSSMSSPDSGAAYKCHNLLPYSIQTIII